MEFPVTAPGAATAAGEFDKLGASMVKSGQQWTQMSQGSAKASAALGAIGTALGPLGEEFGVLGASVSRASGVIGNMTALLGGPWGIAIGAATAAIGVLAKQWSDAKKQAEAMNLSIERQTELAQQLAVARSIATAGVEARTQAEEEYAQQVDERIQAEQRAELARINMLEEAYAAEGKIREHRQGPSQGESFNSLIGSLAGDGEMLSPEIDMLEEERQALWDAEQEREKLALEQKKARDQEYIETERARLAEVESMEQAAYEAELSRQQSLANVQKQIAGDVVSVSMRSINEVVKGNKVGAKAVVQSIGDALVARGTQAILEGTIFSATPFMWGSGGPMIAAGSAAIATGLALGAASRGLPGGGGGGGSGGGINPTTQQLGPATPVMADRTGTGGRG